MSEFVSPSPTVEETTSDIAMQIAKELNARVLIKVFCDEHCHFTIEHDWTLEAQKFMQKCQKGE